MLDLRGIHKSSGYMLNERTADPENRDRKKVHVIDKNLEKGNL